ncbi:MAG TPA: hypothetical protein ENG48_07585 [Candidatus Atribacteria bacterium]|nr:hypothetical protein [Candidatus Atribacteria bacterium]
MANYFTLTLDTTGPANPSISLESGAQYATQQLITASISTDDSDTTNYQMKIWGDVDTTYDADIQDTEGNSSWISYSESKQIKLSSGEGSKTIYLKIRDDVWNESAQASDDIILDTSLPVVTISGPDVSKISKVSGKNVCSFSFTVNDDFVEYKVKVVASSGAAHDTGTQIPTTGGSVNMSGSGSFSADDPINCQIYGADLESADAGDGDKIIKVFAKDSAGNWSV